MSGNTQVKPDIGHLDSRVNATVAFALTPLASLAAGSDTSELLSFRTAGRASRLRRV